MEDADRLLFELEQAINRGVRRDWTFRNMNGQRMMLSLATIPEEEQ